MYCMGSGRIRLNVILIDGTILARERILKEPSMLVAFIKI